MDRSNLRVAFAAAGERGDFRFRMPQQDLDQLDRRVTGRAENGNTNHGSNASGPTVEKPGTHRPACEALLKRTTTGSIPWSLPGRHDRLTPVMCRIV